MREDAAFKAARLNYLAGAIDKADGERFKRLLFRVTKGNNWTYTQDLEIDQNQQKVKKTIFLVVY